MPEEMPYRYFVAYMAEVYGQHAYGAIEVSLRYPVRSMDDVRIMQGMIERSGQTNVAIRHWQRFED